MERVYNHLKVLKPSKKCVYRQKKQSRLNFKNRVNKLLYRFNSKEFDSNTGLYYFGARYMNPRYVVWLSPDPLGDFNPFMNSRHYIDGQHNGGVFNDKNLNSYAYCYQSPIRFVDPNGKQVDIVVDKGNYLLADVGHTFISVGSGKNQTVYTYGRWSGTNTNSSGFHTPLNNGPGVMIKLTGEDEIVSQIF